MPAKRIILMYISQVSGHRSAAEAIEKAIRIISPDAQILGINAFSYTNPISEKVINHLYMSVLEKAPKIWDYLYDNPKVVKALRGIKNSVHKFNAPKLKKLFDEFRPDAVACTQAFPCGMVADFKKIYKSAIPLVAVLTDFVPHSFWLYDTVDFYISPSREVTQRLIERGIAGEKIREFGIPFNPKFNLAVDRSAVLEKLGLSEGVPTVLIMGGGHGLGPLRAIVSSLEGIKRPLQEIVICGANDKLYRALEKDIKKYRQKIVLLGFVDNIHELMSASEMILTKPGGITTAEALTKSLPILIIQPLPGQESSNTKYLTEKGAVVKIDNLKEINTVVEDLLSDWQKLKGLSDASGRISKPNASMDIAKLLLSLSHA